MAAFHLRNIPPELYERLRERASADGRSINGEILAILERDLSQPSADELNRRLDELRAKWAHRELVPPPEDLIREDRDSR